VNSKVLRETGLMLVVCVVLAYILTLIGYGPWTRWVAPAALITAGTLVINMSRARRAGKVGPTD
jgi:hypothetical protein